MKIFTSNNVNTREYQNISSNAKKEKADQLFLFINLKQNQKQFTIIK